MAVILPPEMRHSRPSAAIIPSVNETLTGGLPIGSAEKWLMNSV
jgi:hypothetical protein